MTYLLRDVPDDLWRKVKAKAAANGETLRDVLLRALTDYLKRKS